MKTSFFKFIFFSTLIALAAIGCTNDEIHSGTDDGKVAARISADVQQTRATNAIWNENDAIGVAMINPKTSGVIDPYRNYGYTTSGDGQFSPIDAGHIIYFPTNDEEVTFRSYYPYKKDLSPELVIPVSTKDQTALADIDLMTAEHLSGTSTKDPNVKLHFHHRLAKVVVNLSADGPRESILNGAKLVMKGLKTDATYNLLYEELKVNDASGADVSIPVSSAKSEAIVLPRAAGAGVSFEITTPDGGKYTAAMGSDLELKAGYVHTFNIRLKSPAEISATIEPWTEGPTRRYDVIRVVTGLEETKGFATGNVLDLFLKNGNATDFSLLNKFTYNGTLWTPDAPVYWESIAGDPVAFRGATVIDKALNSTQMDDILISKDVDVKAYTGVNLEMEHAGSKVTIQLQSSDGTYTATDLKNATVVLPDYLNAGSYNDKGEFVPGTTRGNITPENNVAVFPPQTIANGKNILTIAINGRTYEVKAEEAAGFVYERATAYTLIADVRKAKVEMSAVIKPWEEKTVEFKEVRVGSADLGKNEGDLQDKDALYLFTGDDTNRASLPGAFIYDKATDTWIYNGASAPLYWEDITDKGHIYASITRPAITTAEGNNQSADYITATPIVNKGGTDNTAINFKLSHQVAKVNVLLRSKTYEENKLLNANVSLPNYAIGGRLDKGVYVPGTEKGSIMLAKPEKTGTGAEVTYNTASYLQPQTIAQGKGLVTVEIEGRTYTVKPEDIKAPGVPADIIYEAGKVTNLIITVEKTGLSVSVEVTGWTELQALEFEALFFSVSNKASTGFENNDLIKFYKLASDGASVDGVTNDYKYAGGPDHGTLSATGTPWYRDDFQTGDLIAGVYPSSASTLAAGAKTFDWTVKSAGVTNEHADDIMIAAPVANRNLGEIQANGNVAFEFKHVLSKVSINLIAGEGFTSDEIRPSVVAMNNFKLSGTVNVINGIATPKVDVTPAFSPFKLDKVYAVDGKTVVSSYEAFVMPQTISANTVMVSVTLNGAVFQAKLDVNKLFAAGAHNMLNLTLNKTGVVLTASIVDWNKELDTNIDLH
ncbi:MAG TPA: hypothetical protein DDW85_07025 [Porphyromonadaceae bacterium]|nr:hypothetical protein [Porphyromonadaceae bacterium]